jgi:hypothetical protein
MKVIFLDHFGVMCLADKHGREKLKEDLPRVSEMRVHGNFDTFDADAVAVLNSILKTGVEIVVSSDWKRWCSFERMCEFYLSQGIIKPPIDFTPFFENLNTLKNAKLKTQLEILSNQRESEIINWLENHKEVTHWVAIDDIYMNNLKNFVWVSKTDEGIKQHELKEKIIDYLHNSI